MVKVFSFCLYGAYNPKYYLGLKENIEIIIKDFPLFEIYIICGNDIDKIVFFELIKPFINNLNIIHIIEVDIT